MFKEIIFPDNSCAIYVVGFTARNSFITFYAGESTRFLGRVSDYSSANLKAPTDFKVGDFIKISKKHGYGIKILYHDCHLDYRSDRWAAPFLSP